MRESDYDTENQVYPVCPWCNAELDPADLDLELEELTPEDYHLSVNMRCLECDQEMEISVSFVYSTYKNEEDDFDISSGDSFDEEDEYVNL